MNLWWKARLGWLLCVTTAVSAVGSFMLQDVLLVMPNFVTGQTNVFAIAYVIAFLPALVWLAIEERAGFAFESVTVRVKQLALLECALVLVSQCFGFLGLFWSAEPAVQGAGRNLILVAALAMLSTRIVPAQFSFLLPVGYLVVAATAGFGFLSRDPYSWAMILGVWEPERDWWIIGIAVVAAVVVRAVWPSTRWDRPLAPHAR